MKKIILVIALMFGTCMLTACSFIPKKSNAATAEKYAKKYINEQVGLVDTERDSQKDSYRMRSIYHLKDDRDIEFNVMADDEFVSFVDAWIPNFYTNAIKLSTDYKYKVMDHYSTEIDEILSKLKLEKDYTITKYGAHLTVYVSKEESLENIAEAIMEIDDILDYNYKLSSEIICERPERKLIWDNVTAGEINIQMYSPDETNKRKMYQTFEFSDGNEHMLTYEGVLRTLKAGMMWCQSNEDILFAYINDTLFYGTDTLCSDEMDGDISEYDGKMEMFTSTIPQKNGYGNVGSDTPYRFGPDGVVYVYMSDGCRQLYEFTE